MGTISQIYLFLFIKKIFISILDNLHRYADIAMMDINFEAWVGMINLQG